MFTESKAQKVSAFPFNASLTWLCFLIAAILCLPGTTRAQEQFTPAELDTLVSTIALYPDPLLVQVLAASVHGDEIPGSEGSKFNSFSAFLVASLRFWFVFRK